MRVNFRGLCLGGFAVLATALPAASAAGAQPRRRSPTRPPPPRRAPVLRHPVGDRAARSPPLDRLPVDGVLGVRTSGPATADWDLGIIDRTRARRSAAPPRPPRTSTRPPLVREGQRLALQTCRRKGSDTVGVRYHVHQRPQGPGLGLRDQAGARRDADERRQGAPRRPRARHDRPPGPDHWDVLLHSEAEERKLRGAGFTLDRVADVRPATAPTARRSGATAGRPRPRDGARLDRRAAAPRTARCRSTSRSSRPSPTPTPASCGCSRCPGARSEGREIMGVEIAENVRRAPTTAARTTSRSARTTPASGRPTRRRSSSASSSSTATRAATPRLAGDRPGRADVRHPGPQRRRLRRDDRVRGPEPRRLTSTTRSTPAARRGDQASASGAYKRKTCRDRRNRAPRRSRASPATYDERDADRAHADRGVDPNRNYGVEWGGPGTEQRRRRT